MQCTSNVKKATFASGIARPSECTALGNELVQDFMQGHSPSLTAACEVVRNSFELTIVSPEPAVEWDKAFTRFENLLK